MSSEEHKDIYKKYYITDYKNINRKYNNTDSNALMISCCEGKTNITRLLLNHPKINVNIKDDDGWVALTYACFNKFTDIVNLLLSHPSIDVNTKVKRHKKTCLLQSCIINDIEITKLLLEHPKIDVNIKDKCGRTVFDYAKKYGYTELINLLKSYGAK